MEKETLRKGVGFLALGQLVIVASVLLGPLVGETLVTILQMLGCGLGIYAVAQTKRPPAPLTYAQKALIVHVVLLALRFFYNSDILAFFTTLCHSVQIVCLFFTLRDRVGRGIGRLGGLLLAMAAAAFLAHGLLLLFFYLTPLNAAPAYLVSLVCSMAAYLLYPIYLGLAYAHMAPGKEVS